MDAGPSKLQDFAAYLFERAEIKKFLTVVAKVPLGTIPALHAVRSGQLPGARVMHHQVVADKEAIAVQASPGRTVQPLPKLAIKNQVAQPLAIDDIFQRLRQLHTEEVGSGKWISAVVRQDSGR
jgi:hypothetical protein